MRELIGSVMVSSPLLLTFGTLSLLLYFRLPSKGRSITTLGTRWHDFFFITSFRYFTIVLFFTLHFFSFSHGMQTRERAHCARSVFPFIIKKKKKNKKKKKKTFYESFILVRNKNHKFLDSIPQTLSSLQTLVCEPLH